MLGILKKKHPEKEENKEILHKVLNHEESVPELPMDEPTKTPEIPTRSSGLIEHDIEPPFASWNDNVSDDEIPMPPPLMERKAPERPVQETRSPSLVSHRVPERPVQNNPMLPPVMERKAPERPVQEVPMRPPVMNRPPGRPVQAHVETKPFRASSIKGPVFLSLSKYQEVKSMLSDLKRSSAELRDILAELKKNRDGGTSLLEQSVERLSTIENSLEEISATLRAG